jgi:hypothetical protein
VKFQLLKYKIHIENIEQEIILINLMNYFGKLIFSLLKIIIHLFFSNVSNSKDLGKNIKWPAPKPGFIPMNNMFKKIYQR